MRWIGLTGGIASGKSTVGQILEKNGFSVVDADLLAREVVKPGQKPYEEIVSYFGPEILSEDQTIDRKKLADIVFKDHEKLEELERMTHPHIGFLAEQKRKEMQDRGDQVGFYMIPLLFENNLKSHFDQVVVVKCSQDNQVGRMGSRDGFSEDEIQHRVSAQVPLSEKALLADIVIENDGSLADLEENVIKAIEQNFKNSSFE